MSAPIPCAARFQRLHGRWRGGWLRTDFHSMVPPCKQSGRMRHPPPAGPFMRPLEFIPGGQRRQAQEFLAYHASSFPASFGSGHQSGMPGSRFALTNPALLAIGVHGNSRPALRQTGMRDTFPNAPLWSLRGHSPQSRITILRAVMLEPLSVRAGSKHSPCRPGFAFAILWIPA